MSKPVSSAFFNESSKNEETNANTGWQPFGSRRPSLISPAMTTSNDLMTNDPLGRLQDYAFPPVQRNSAINTASNNEWSTNNAAAPWSVLNTGSMTSPTEYPDIASVPMLPEVSGEPFYREHRSMSYSFGFEEQWQLKHHFQQQQHHQLQQHYNMISNNKNAPLFSNNSGSAPSNLLDTMHEEEEEEGEEEDLLRARVRSKSSAAVMDIWSPLKDNRNNHAFHRRLSLAPISLPPPPILPTTSSLYTPQMSAGDRERIRRFSLTPLTLDTHNPFTTSSNHSSSNDNANSALLAQRRHSLAGPTHISSMDALTETVESLAIQPHANNKKEDEMEEDINIDDMGKGVKFDSEVLSNVIFYAIEFKGGRSDIFYSPLPNFKQDDLVIVEADRGRDLGKISMENISRSQIESFYRSNRNIEDEPSEKKQEIYIKRIFRHARPDEITLLLAKGQDESKALIVCQSKIKQKKLNMQVVDAEYQW
ncbi:hypothetical protein BCV72DRAFT_228582 [Rhizopus microsporus var. microsporus]|uniref:PSP1 C-terminal domain-containing protein n=1 Tax=Rhizopus microsporus var. microsporus TaxID=86635 RepID=A0A1X0R2Q5_RHIZD|nr:hypothetical protein BCV72DRAFT_228582 [Rhizopus microsporus var. microsporus]